MQTGLSVLRKNKEVVLLILFFTFVYSFVSIIRHNNFESFGFDLGIFDQEIWLLSRFKYPYSTIKQMVIWGDHFSPSIVLLAPLYYLFDVRGLLFFQSMIVCLGGVPIYLLSMKYLKDKFLCLAFCFCYLLYYGIQNAVIFDFHLIVVVAGLLPWLFWFADSGKWRYYFELMIILLLFKEDVSLIIVSIGLILLFNKKSRSAGLVTIIVSGIAFFVVTKVLIPFFNPGGFVYQPEFPSSVADFIRQMTTPVVKLKTVFVSMLPFLFLPLFSGIYLIPILIHFGVHFIGENLVGRWDIYLHYRAPVACFVAIASIYGLYNLSKVRKLSRKILQLIGGLLVLATLFTQYYYHLPLNSLFKKDFYRKRDNVEVINEMIENIPSGASVSTQNNIITHLTHREKVCIFPNVCDAEYILVDLSEGQTVNNYFNGVYHDLEEYRVMFDELLEGDYEVAEKRGEVYLARKKR